MEKTTIALKLNYNLIKRFRSYCKERGIKYGFFVEEAIREKLEEEKLKDDILDLKTLRKEEESAIPFEDYLRKRHV